MSRLGRSSIDSTIRSAWRPRKSSRTRSQTSRNHFRFRSDSRKRKTISGDKTLRELQGISVSIFASVDNRRTATMRLKTKPAAIEAIVRDKQNQMALLRLDCVKYIFPHFGSQPFSERCLALRTRIAAGVLLSVKASPFLDTGW